MLAGSHKVYSYDFNVYAGKDLYLDGGETLSENRLGYSVIIKLMSALL